MKAVFISLLAVLVLLPVSREANGQAPAVSNEFLAATLSELVRDALPREYERRKDWGDTKRITTGLKSSGEIWKLRIHRRKKHVNHGTWKLYRVRLIEPEERLRVEVQDLRSLEGGGVGLQIVVDADLAGWGQLRQYNRGVHLLTLTAEGTSRLRLVVDGEVRLRVTTTGVAIDPRVTAARLDLRDFDLHRLGEVEGRLVHELGKGMKRLVEDQLESDKLTAKLNRAIDKKRDRLVLSPAQLFEAVKN